MADNSIFLIDIDKIIKEKCKNKALQWGNALFLGLNLWNIINREFRKKNSIVVTKNIYNSESTKLK